MVKVFKTDVHNIVKADNIINNLLLRYPDFRINFYLNDSDRILRVEGAYFKAEDISDCLKEHGFTCIDLPIDLS